MEVLWTQWAFVVTRNAVTNVVSMYSQKSGIMNKDKQHMMKEYDWVDFVKRCAFDE